MRFSDRERNGRTASKPPKPAGSIKTNARESIRSATHDADPARTEDGRQPSRHPLVRLQQTSGNRAVQRLLKREKHSHSSTARSDAADPSAVVRNPGRTLNAETRGEMETGFGHDFGDVRVHTSARAAAAAEAVGADAYTIGREVVFGRGQYQPKTTAGRYLLAHELTHVVQQDAVSTNGNILRVVPSRSVDALERDADRVAARVVAGSTATPRLGPASGTPLLRREQEGTTDPAHVGAVAEGISLQRGEGPEGETVAPGERGYSRLLLAASGPIGRNLRGVTEEMELQQVELTHEGLDRQIRERAAEEADYREKWRDESGFFGSHFAAGLYKEAADWCQERVNEMEQDRSREDQKVARFNWWVPYANVFYQSTRRLSAMEYMLGAHDPASTVAALEQGLREAKDVGLRAQRLDASIDVPQVDPTVVQASTELTLAAEDMHAAWLDFQRDVLSERAAETEAEGQEAREKRQEIEQVKEFVRNVGKTIDLTMTTVKSAPTHAATASNAIRRAEATVGAMRNRRQIMAGQRPTHRPTYLTTGEDGELVVRNVQTGMDRPAGGGETTPSPSPSFSLPTSVESILGGIADFAYADEIREINVALEQIKSRVDAIQGVQEFLAIRNRAVDFQNKLNYFAAKSKHLQDRMAQRRQDYLEFGLQLDRFARRDVETRRAGQAPERNAERYATIMTLVPQVREVLVAGRGARGAFDKPDEIRQWFHDLERRRGKRPPRTDLRSFRLTSEELETIQHIYSQVRLFHSNVDSVEDMYGPVDTEASKLIESLHQGGGSGEY